MSKEDIMNRISFALKDSVLQMGFEVICSKLARLEKENAELKEQCLILADCNTCKNENVEIKKQLTKAKEIIKDYMIIAKGDHTTVCGVPEENRTIFVLKLNEEAEQFLNGEVEKLIESPVDHIIEQNEKEVSLNPDYFSGGW